MNDQGLSNVISILRIFDHESLMIHLRLKKAREEYAKQKELEEERLKASREAAPQNELFDKQYIEGKGMRSGGFGDLLVYKHYQIE